uniref:Small ribosomal subunit protein eS6 n=1 Tax=Cyanoderma ruficeps TaxID=181631 RepID=A0A8C3QHD1_9PASS
MIKGRSCYGPQGTEERKCKSICNCIVDANLSVLISVIVKKGEKGIPGLTDAEARTLYVILKRYCTWYYQ